MKETALKLTTVQVPIDDSYYIEDMERMFGKRIAKAINKDVDKSGRMYRAIIAKEMAKICKRWKFWNADIRKAYKNYVGMLLVPWTIEPPVMTYMSSETEELVTKEFDASKYKTMSDDNR